MPVFSLPWNNLCALLPIVALLVLLLIGFGAELVMRVRESRRVREQALDAWVSTPQAQHQREVP